MIEVFRAELLKLTRPRALLFTAIAVVVAATVATTATFISAESGNGPAAERGTTLAELAEAGGGTEAFALGMSFTGFFVFVVLTANWATEFSQGTFRTLLMKQPRRLSLLGGKLAGLLVFAAGVLVAFEAVIWGMSLVAAPTQDVSTSAWFSLDAIGEGIEDYGIAFLVVSAWSAFAMTLAVLIRSVPLALGAGIAWAGPFEHITSEAWNAATGVYPGLLLEALAVGGTPDVSFTRAASLLAGYVAVAVAIGVLVFTRRDITG
jgi:ABC-2 type transport system permease protein